MDLDDQAFTAPGVVECFSAVNSLQDWGAAVENCVDVALRAGFGNKPHLPKSFRGRCKPLKIVKCPVNSAIKQACPGSYEPSTEVLTMATRRKITQLRRIESLHRRLRKISGLPFDWDVHCQLLAEWKAVAHNTAFGCPFLHWLARFPDMDYPDFPLPTVAWMFETLQLTRHFVDASLQDDAKIQRAKIVYERVLDKQKGHTKAFAMVRGPGPPPVTHISTKHYLDAIVVTQEDGKLHEVFADSSAIAQLSRTFPVAIGSVPGTIVSMDSAFFTVATVQAVDLTSDDAKITQDQTVMAPPDVASELSGFWQPIWQRDTRSLDFMKQTPDTLGFATFLSAVPPRPEIQATLSDPSIWTRAISKLRTASARGTDSISAQELKLLPPVAIESLASLFATSTRPFDDSFMNGLVAPLSKAGSEVPSRDRTRPITILPQLYRLWASVLCMQITYELQSWAPPEITGFLPKRGAVSAVVHAQHQLEWSHWKRIVLTGLVLDLRKCFNCLRQSFCYHAMKSCGVPVWILDAWIVAQDSLHRFWMLHGQLFEAGKASTGCPEGDQFSVIAMLCVSIAWVAFVKQFSVYPAQLCLTAYADNWSWTVQQPSEHAAILRATQEFIHAAGVSIDWDKTWWWVSQSCILDEVAAAISAVAPVPVTRLRSASDLGFQMQYGQLNRLGILHQRIETGFQRLKRLSSMACSLAVKEHMLVSSIYPATFHGSETKPPAQDVFQRMRSAASRALIGEATTLSSPIALLFGAKGILDPEFHYVCRLLATVRLYLLSLSPQRVLDFCHLAAHFLGSLHQVHGPAAALGFTLRSLGWQIDSSGVISVGAFLSVDFVNCSFQRLRRFLEFSWEIDLVKSSTSRWSWFSFPDISVTDTRQVLSQFGDSQRVLLIREISGGYQLAGQKKHWLEGEDGSCCFCGMDDSRRHRLEECPIGADIRENYTSLFSFVESSGSCMLDWPVVCVHPSSEALRVLHFRLSFPSWSVSVIDALQRHVDLGGVPRFYTDGACQFPNLVNCRYAAFAVVWDMCMNDAERIVFADACRYSGDFTRVFQKIAAAMTPGEQDILRSEISAIVNVIENFYTGEIYVDSQTALSLSLLALRSSDRADFAGKEHFDLLLRIWARRSLVNFRLHKVKSHDNFAKIQDPLTRFHAMGNAAADGVAVSARDKLLPQVVKEHLVVHRDLTQDKDHLYALFRLHLQLLEARGKKLQIEKKTSSPLIDFQQVWRAFEAWTVPISVFRTGLADLSLLQFSSFGERLAKLTHAWLVQLKWPEENTGPLNFVCGISWIELGLSWMCTNNCYLPVLRKDQDGQLRVRILGSVEDAVDAGFSFTEAGTMVEKMIGNVQGLIPQSVFPVVTRKKSAALYHLGAGKYYQGLTVRPELPAQSKVFAILKKTLQGGAIGNGMTGTPQLEVPQGESGLLPFNWARRSTTATTAMCKARAARKRL